MRSSSDLDVPHTTAKIFEAFATLCRDDVHRSKGASVFNASTLDAIASAPPAVAGAATDAAVAAAAATAVTCAATFMSPFRPLGQFRLLGGDGPARATPSERIGGRYSPLVGTFSSRYLGTFAQLDVVADASGAFPPFFPFHPGASAEAVNEMPCVGRVWVGVPSAVWHACRVLSFDAATELYTVELIDDLVELTETDPVMEQQRRSVRRNVDGAELNLLFPESAFEHIPHREADVSLLRRQPAVLVGSIEDSAEDDFSVLRNETIHVPRAHLIIRSDVSPRQWDLVDRCRFAQRTLPPSVRACLFSQLFIEGDAGLRETASAQLWRVLQRGVAGLEPKPATVDPAVHGQIIDEMLQLYLSALRRAHLDDAMLHPALRAAFQPIVSWPAPVWHAQERHRDERHLRNARELARARKHACTRYGDAAVKEFEFGTNLARVAKSAVLWHRLTQRMFHELRECWYQQRFDALALFVVPDSRPIWPAEGQGPTAMLPPDVVPLAALISSNKAASDAATARLRVTYYDAVSSIVMRHLNPPQFAFTFLDAAAYRASPLRHVLRVCTMDVSLRVRDLLLQELHRVKAWLQATEDALGGAKPAADEYDVVGDEWSSVLMASTLDSVTRIGVAVEWDVEMQRRIAHQAPLLGEMGAAVTSLGQVVHPTTSVAAVAAAIQTAVHSAVESIEALPSLEAILVHSGVGVDSDACLPLDSALVIAAVADVDHLVAAVTAPACRIEAALTARLSELVVPISAFSAISPTSAAATEVVPRKSPANAASDDDDDEFRSFGRPEYYRRAVDYYFDLSGGLPQTSYTTDTARLEVDFSLVRARIDEVRRAVPDTVYAGVIAFHCADVKQRLTDAWHAERLYLEDLVSEQIVVVAQRATVEMQRIVARLRQRPSNAEEMLAFIDYSDGARRRLGDIRTRELQDVLCWVRLLETFFVPISAICAACAIELAHWPARLDDEFASSEAQLEEEKARMLESVLNLRKDICPQVDVFADLVDELYSAADGDFVDDTVQSLDAGRTMLEGIERQVAALVAQERVFGIAVRPAVAAAVPTPGAPYVLWLFDTAIQTLSQDLYVFEERLQRATAEFRIVDRFWRTVRDAARGMEEMLSTPLHRVDAAAMERSIEGWRAALHNGIRRLRGFPAARETGQRIAARLATFHCNTIPVVRLLRGPGMRDTQWRELSRLVGIRAESESGGNIDGEVGSPLSALRHGRLAGLGAHAEDPMGAPLSLLLESKIALSLDIVEAVATRAAEENAVESGLDRIRRECRAMRFEFVHLHERDIGGAGGVGSREFSTAAADRRRGEVSDVRVARNLPLLQSRMEGYAVAARRLAASPFAADTQGPALEWASVMDRGAEMLAVWHRAQAHLAALFPALARMREVGSTDAVTTADGGSGGNAVAAGNTEGLVWRFREALYLMRGACDDVCHSANIHHQVVFAVTKESIGVKVRESDRILQALRGELLSMLDSRRAGFPRLFMVSDDALITFLAAPIPGDDMRRFTPLLHAVFPAAESFITPLPPPTAASRAATVAASALVPFGPDPATATVIGLRAWDGCCLDFIQPVVPLAPDDTPSGIGEPVDEWLQRLERAVRTAFITRLDAALHDVVRGPMHSWLAKCSSAQVASLALRARFTHEIEQVLSVAGGGAALTALTQKEHRSFEVLLPQSGARPTRDRSVMAAAVITYLMQRDTVDALVRQEVTTVDEFRAQPVLRTYTNVGPTSCGADTLTLDAVDAALDRDTAMDATEQRPAIPSSNEKGAPTRRAGGQTGLGAEPVPLGAKAVITHLCGAEVPYGFEFSGHGGAPVWTDAEARFALGFFANAAAGAGAHPMLHTPAQAASGASRNYATETVREVAEVNGIPCFDFQCLPAPAVTAATQLLHLRQHMIGAMASGAWLLLADVNSLPDELQFALAQTLEDVAARARNATFELAKAALTQGDTPAGLSNSEPTGANRGFLSAPAQLVEVSRRGLFADAPGLMKTPLHPVFLCVGLDGQADNVSERRALAPALRAAFRPLAPPTQPDWGAVASVAVAAEWGVAPAHGTVAARLARLWRLMTQGAEPAAALFTRARMVAVIRIAAALDPAGARADAAVLHALSELVGSTLALPALSTATWDEAIAVCFGTLLSRSSSVTDANPGSGSTSWPPLLPEDSPSVQALCAAVECSPIVSVVGPAFSGKSSLLRRVLGDEAVAGPRAVCFNPRAYSAAALLGRAILSADGRHSEWQPGLLEVVAAAAAATDHPLIIDCPSWYESGTVEELTLSGLTESSTRGRRMVAGGGMPRHLGRVGLGLTTVPNKTADATTAAGELTPAAPSLRIVVKLETLAAASPRFIASVPIVVAPNAGAADSGTAAWGGPWAFGLDQIPLLRSRKPRPFGRLPSSPRPANIIGNQLRETLMSLRRACDQLASVFFELVAHTNGREKSSHCCPGGLRTAAFRASTQLLPSLLKQYKLFDTPTASALTAANGGGKLTGSSSATQTLSGTDVANALGRTIGGGAMPVTSAINCHAVFAAVVFSVAWASCGHMSPAQQAAVERALHDRATLEQIEAIAQEVDPMIEDGASLLPRPAFEGGDGLFGSCFKIVPHIGGLWVPFTQAPESALALSHPARPGTAVRFDNHFLSAEGGGGDALAAVSYLAVLCRGIYVTGARASGRSTLLRAFDAAVAAANARRGHDAHGWACVRVTATAATCGEEAQRAMDAVTLRPIGTDGAVAAALVPAAGASRLLVLIDDLHLPTNGTCAEWAGALALAQRVTSQKHRVTHMSAATPCCVVATACDEDARPSGRLDAASDARFARAFVPYRMREPADAVFLNVLLAHFDAMTASAAHDVRHFVSRATQPCVRFLCGAARRVVAECVDRRTACAALMASIRAAAAIAATLTVHDKESRFTDCVVSETHSCFSQFVGGTGASSAVAAAIGAEAVSENLVSAGGIAPSPTYLLQECVDAPDVTQPPFALRLAGAATLCPPASDAASAASGQAFSITSPRSRKAVSWSVARADALVDLPPAVVPAPSIVARSELAERVVSRFTYLSTPGPNRPIAAVNPYPASGGFAQAVLSIAQAIRVCGPAQGCVVAAPSAAAARRAARAAADGLLSLVFLDGPTAVMSSSSAATDAEPESDVFWLRPKGVRFIDSTAHLANGDLTALLAADAASGVVHIISVESTDGASGLCGLLPALRSWPMLEMDDCDVSKALAATVASSLLPDGSVDLQSAMAAAIAAIADPNAVATLGLESQDDLSAQVHVCYAALLHSGRTAYLCRRLGEAAAATSMLEYTVQTAAAAAAEIAVCGPEITQVRARMVEAATTARLARELVADRADALAECERAAVGILGDAERKRRAVEALQERALTQYTEARTTLKACEPRHLDVLRAASGPAPSVRTLIEGIGVMLREDPARYARGPAQIGPDLYGVVRRLMETPENFVSRVCAVDGGILCEAFGIAGALPRLAPYVAVCEQSRFAQYNKAAQALADFTLAVNARIHSHQAQLALEFELESKKEATTSLVAQLEAIRTQLAEAESAAKIAQSKHDAVVAAEAQLQRRLEAATERDAQCAVLASPIAMAARRLEMLQPQWAAQDTACAADLAVMAIQLVFLGRVACPAARHRALTAAATALGVDTTAQTGVDACQLRALTVLQGAYAHCRAGVAVPPDGILQASERQGLRLPPFAAALLRVACNGTGQGTAAASGGDSKLHVPATADIVPLPFARWPLIFGADDAKVVALIEAELRASFRSAAAAGVVMISAFDATGTQAAMEAAMVNGGAVIIRDWSLMGDNAALPDWFTPQLRQLPHCRLMDCLFRDNADEGTPTDAATTETPPTPVHPEFALVFLGTTHNASDGVTPKYDPTIASHFTILDLRAETALYDEVTLLQRCIAARPRSDAQDASFLAAIADLDRAVVHTHAHTIAMGHACLKLAALRDADTTGAALFAATGDAGCGPLTADAARALERCSELLDVAVKETEQWRTEVAIKALERRLDLAAPLAHTVSTAAATVDAVGSWLARSSHSSGDGGALLMVAAPLDLRHPACVEEIVARAYTFNRSLKQTHVDEKWRSLLSVRGASTQVTHVVGRAALQAVYTLAAPAIAEAWRPLLVLALVATAAADGAFAEIIESCPLQPAEAQSVLTVLAGRTATALEAAELMMGVADQLQRGANSATCAAVKELSVICARWLWDDVAPAVASPADKFAAWYKSTVLLLPKVPTPTRRSAVYAAPWLETVRSLSPTVAKAVPIFVVCRDSAGFCVPEAVEQLMAVAAAVHANVTSARASDLLRRTAPRQGGPASIDISAYTGSSSGDRWVLVLASAADAVTSSDLAAWLVAANDRAAAAGAGAVQLVVVVSESDSSIFMEPHAEGKSPCIVAAEATSTLRGDSTVTHLGQLLVSAPAQPQRPAPALTTTNAATVRQLFLQHRRNQDRETGGGQVVAPSESEGAPSAPVSEEAVPGALPTTQYSRALRGPMTDVPCGFANVLTPLAALDAHRAQANIRPLFGVVAEPLPFREQLATFLAPNGGLLTQPSYGIAPLLAHLWAQSPAADDDDAGAGAGSAPRSHAASAVAQSQFAAFQSATMSSADSRLNKFVADLLAQEDTPVAAAAGVRTPGPPTRATPGSLLPNSPRHAMLPDASFVLWLAIVCERIRALPVAVAASCRSGSADASNLASIVACFPQSAAAMPSVLRVVTNLFVAIRMQGSRRRALRAAAEFKRVRAVQDKEGIRNVVAARAAAAMLAASAHHQPSDGASGGASPVPAAAGVHLTPTQPDATPNRTPRRPSLAPPVAHSTPGRRASRVGAVTPQQQQQQQQQQQENRFRLDAQYATIESQHAAARNSAAELVAADLWAQMRVLLELSHAATCHGRGAEGLPFVHAVAPHASADGTIAWADAVALRATELGFAAAALSDVCAPTKPPARKQLSLSLAPLLAAVAPLTAADATRYEVVAMGSASPPARHPSLPSAVPRLRPASALSTAVARIGESPTPAMPLELWLGSLLVGPNPRPLRLVVAPTEGRPLPGCVATCALVAPTLVVLPTRGSGGSAALAQPRSQLSVYAIADDAASGGAADVTLDMTTTATMGARLMSGRVPLASLGIVRRHSIDPLPPALMPRVAALFVRGHPIAVLPFVAN